MLTPVGAYLRLAHSAKYSFLLESVEGGENIARYTFAGANPEEVFRARGRESARSKRGGREIQFDDDPIEQLRRLTARYHPVRVPGLPPLIGGAIGYFAYDMVRLIERIPAAGRDDLALDDCVMMFFLGRGRLRSRAASRLDHSQRFHRREGKPSREIRCGGARNPRSHATEAGRTASQAAPHAAESQTARFESNLTRPQYLAAVRKAKAYIRAGDIFQVVPSQRFSARTDADPFEIYRALRVVNPSPYCIF